MYLTGVAPGSYTFTATGLGNPAPPTPAGTDLPAGFTRCAAEGGQCSFAGTRRVAYGAGTYTTKTATDGTACTNAPVNGDPAVNLVKSCYVAPLGGPSGYARCAAENGTCNFNGTQTIAYGARGSYVFRSFTGTTACTTAAFGSDSLFDVQKACYLTP